MFRKRRDLPTKRNLLLTLKSGKLIYRERCVILQGISDD